MENEGGKAFGWFVSGVLLGAAGALLLTPDTGIRMRRRIANQANTGRKSLLESSQEIFDKGRELYERGREIAEEAAELFERGRRIAEKQVDERV